MKRSIKETIKYGLMVPIAALSIGGPLSAGVSNSNLEKMLNEQSKNTITQNFNQESKKSPTLPSMALGTIGAVYTSVILHEDGHYKRAGEYGLGPRIEIGPTKEGNLGRTYWKTTPQREETKKDLALAGIENTRKVYEALNKEIKEGKASGRFASALALKLKSDFPAYVLQNYLSRGENPYDDIEQFTGKSKSRKRFVRAAAIADLAFSWRDIAYHIKKVLGGNPPAPKRTSIKGMEIRPKVFIKGGDLAIGFEARKKW